MVKFDHTESSVPSALGIPQNRTEQLSASIMFEMINQAFLVRKLFDNPDDAPVNFTRKTGILERLFDDASNEAERIFLTWEFSKIDLSMHKNDKMRTVLQALSLLYSACDADKDKFIQKFIEHQRMAEEASDEEDDD
jgi:hypothetical protein